MSKQDLLVTCSSLVTLGKETSLPYGLMLKGDVTLPIKPRSIIVNSPYANMFFVNDIVYGNMSMFAECGLTDTLLFWNNGKGRKVNWPTIPVYSNLTVYMYYNGYIPPGYCHGIPWTVSCTILGTAR